MTNLPSHRPDFGEAEIEAVADVLRSRWVGYGEVTQQFERELEAYLGVRHVFAVTTGTSALMLALSSLELPPGSEVIVPSLTFVSTVQAIVVSGLRPRFCDVLEETLCLDVTDARSCLTDRTRAILPVHYGGQPCAMDEIGEFATSTGLRIVEDAAHAFGSSYRGRRIGSIGDLTCFSFDAIKNITCAGGGAVATDDDELASRLRPLRNVGVTRESWVRHGESQPWRYEVVETGHRCLMGDLHAAIGRVQLSRLDEFRRKKHQIFTAYREGLMDMPGVRLIDYEHDETLPFNVVIRVDARIRDDLMRYLLERGIRATVQFPPNHLQPVFSAYHRTLPVTERLFGEIINLPIYTEMQDSDVQRVLDALSSGIELLSVENSLGEVS